MHKRRQNHSLLGAIVATVVLLGACSPDGDAEKSSANGGEAVAAETSVDGASAAEQESAGSDGGTLQVETGDDEAAAPAAQDDPEDEQPTSTVSETEPETQASTVAESINEEVGEVLTETGEGLSGSDLELYLARRYEAYWQAFDLARQAPTTNPTADFPALATLAAGDQLELTYGELVDLSAAGHAIREPDVPAVPGLDQNSSHRIRIESLEAGVAELVSCLVNDNVRFDVATGEVLSEQVITATTRTTMAKADGTWKVIRSAAIGLDEGVAGCWLEPEDTYPL